MNRWNLSDRGPGGYVRGALLCSGRSPPFLLVGSWWSFLIHEITNLIADRRSTSLGPSLVGAAPG